MLARTMKTHTELGLVKHEYDALVTTLYMIEDGQIPLNLVHMPSYKDRLACGTCHCLAGWAHEVDENAFPELEQAFCNPSDELRARLPMDLQRLFWICCTRKPSSDADTPAKLRTYLETGTCD